MSLVWTFDGIENKHDVYGGEDCMKTFCKSCREHAIKVINFEKKMLSLINDQQESYEQTTFCYISKKMFGHKYTNEKIIVKLKTIVIILVNT